MSEESYLKALAEDVKWGESPDIQTISLELLAGYGEKAIPYLEEIRTVSTQEETRQTCMEAINRLQTMCEKACRAMNRQYIGDL